MEMVFKKEVKHSVVYEALEDVQDPMLKSVYVSKVGLIKNFALTRSTWPKKITVVISQP